jgi:5-oxoprolinase (ATP-hydrolysing) subunit A
MNKMDINADVGEQPRALLDGSEEQLVRLITSANIACGGHAGDDASMRSVVKFCLGSGVGIGAHPGYPDKSGFGRRKIDIPLEELESSLCEQIGRLAEVAVGLGTRLRHVKPHGALYNEAAVDPELARSIARAVTAVDKSLVLVGLAGSAMLEVWRAEGFRVVGEAFADRHYEADGSLRPRRFADALITDPSEAGEQALGIAREGIVVAIDGTRVEVEARTICIHGDTKNPIAIATEVRSRLLAAGVAVNPF